MLGVVEGVTEFLPMHRRGATSGKPLEAITNRDALIIGFAQALACWPGTSRSLVTILAGCSSA